MLWLECLRYIIILGDRKVLRASVIPDKRQWSISSKSKRTLELDSPGSNLTLPPTSCVITTKLFNLMDVLLPSL